MDELDKLNVFAVRLTMLLKRNRITKQELAKEIGISRPAVSQLATGVNLPTVGNLVAIANFFNVSLDFLMGHEIKTIEFGSILRGLRKQADISADDLANVLCVKKRTVFAYESNEVKPSYDNLLKIADFFCVSIDYLVGRKPPYYAEKKVANFE